MYGKIDTILDIFHAKQCFIFHMKFRYQEFADMISLLFQVR